MKVGPITLDAFAPAMSELRAAILPYRSALMTVALVTAVLNILLLSGSMYMMIVYDSVLPSQSIPTLIFLLILLVFLYLFQGGFDYLRLQLLNDVANGFDQRLTSTVQRAMSNAVLRGARQGDDSLLAMRDLDAIRSFLGGAGPVALLDFPWSLLFFLTLFLLHPYLGLTALVGAAILIMTGLVMNRFTQASVRNATNINTLRGAMMDRNLRQIELHTVLGMRERQQERWNGINQTYLALQARLSRNVGTASAVTRTLRLLVQSLVFTVGVLLVIDGRASGGVIFASSILSGRALAPVDQIIDSWKNLTRARQGWLRLDRLLGQHRVIVDKTRLPPPRKEMLVQQLTSAPPGSQTLLVQGVDFRLTTGDALGILGPSGAGKTSLARVLLGIWPALRGAVRLDGASISQWDSDDLGQHLGYLPQVVELSEGTIAQNISRFTPDPDSAAILAATQAAAVHDMIVSLPQGYDTPLSDGGAELSAGQRQRIGLARALYGNPFLVVLDEPNSNLDAEGEMALNAAILAIRKRGGVAIVIAHRPSVLDAVSHLLLMRNGRMEMFGPRDKVREKLAAQRGAIATMDRSAAANQANGQMGAKKDG